MSFNSYKWLVLSPAIIIFNNTSFSQPLLTTTIIEKKDTVVNPLLKGVWKSIGDGYLLNAGNKRIVLYSYTSKHCYEEKNDYPTDLLNSSSLFSLNPSKDTISVYLQDLGKKTTQLQVEKKYYKLKQMPADCMSFKEMIRQGPVFMFELFWLTLKENYAFAKERNIDWDQIYKDYRLKVSERTTKTELFDLMGEIVTFTRDQHVKIIAEDGKTKQFSGLPTATLLREVFDQQKEVKDFNAFAGQFFNTGYRNISDDLLKGKGKKIANGKIEWGLATPDIGYIHIHALTGFASGILPRKQHLDTLNFYMNQIMKSLENKKAIIIDVSFNFGGYDAAGLTIASYFTNKPVPVYTRYTFQQDSFYKSSPTIIFPSEKYHYTKPVYVVTTDITRSAAESFVMQMKAIPNVTIVGTNTLGILSDMLGKSVGDYYLTISNEKYVTPAGEMYEAKGVDPDIKMEVFPKENMFNGHRDAIRKIVEIIENMPGGPERLK